MILVLYSISHLGQRLSLFTARAGLEKRSTAMHLQRNTLHLGRAGAAHPSLQLSLHGAMLQQVTARCCINNVGTLAGTTKTPVGSGDLHLQDMVQHQAGVLLERN